MLSRREPNGLAFRCFKAISTRTTRTTPSRNRSLITLKKIRFWLKKGESQRNKMQLRVHPIPYDNPRRILRHHWRYRCEFWQSVEESITHFSEHGSSSLHVKVVAVEGKYLSQQRSIKTSMRRESFGERSFNECIINILHFIRSNYEAKWCEQRFMQEECNVWSLSSRKVKNKKFLLRFQFAQSIVPGSVG